MLSKLVAQYHKFRFITYFALLYRQKMLRKILNSSNFWKRQLCNLQSFIYFCTKINYSNENSEIKNY